MKRIAFIISLAAALTVSCGQNTEKKTDETPDIEIQKDTNETTTTTMEMKKIEQPEFDIITTHGTMRVRLYDKTPLHRDNFVKLVSEKYHDTGLSKDS